MDTKLCMHIRYVWLIPQQTVHMALKRNYFNNKIFKVYTTWVKVRVVQWQTGIDGSCRCSTRQVEGCCIGTH